MFWLAFSSFSFCAFDTGSGVREKNLFRGKIREREREAGLEPKKELLSEPSASVEPEPISRNSLDLSYKRVETAQLEIQVGIDYFPINLDFEVFFKGKHSFGGSLDELQDLPPLPIQIKGIQRPFVNFIGQIPILTPTGNLRWLIQAGIGRQSFLIDLENREMDSYYEYRFCSPFFLQNEDKNSPKYRQCSVYNKSKKALKESSAFWYIPVQTGFQINYKPFVFSLSVGGFFGLPKQYGGTGKLMMGWNFSDQMSLSVGTNALYYNDKLEWGYSIVFGLYGKKWTQNLF